MAKKSRKTPIHPRFTKKQIKIIRKHIKEKVDLRKSAIMKRFNKERNKILERLYTTEGIDPDSVEGQLLKRRVRPAAILPRIQERKKFSFIGIDKNTGVKQYFNEKLGKAVSGADVNRSLAMLRYWGQVKWIRDVLGISLKTAKKLIRESKDDADLNDALERAGLKYVA